MPQAQGHIRQLPVSPEQVGLFHRLIASSGDRVGDLLFTVAYASQALFKSIREPETEVEREIDALVNGDSKVSPFYHTLEIFLPRELPGLLPDKPLDYRIHFERVRANRAYLASLQCEQEGRIGFRSVYKLVGIKDSVILRMAKEIHHFMK